MSDEVKRPVASKCLSPGHYAEKLEKYAGHLEARMREVERERDAYKSAIDVLASKSDKFRNERDEWKGMYMLCDERESELMAERDDLRRENARLEQIIHAINIEGVRIHNRNGEFKAAVRDIIFPVAATLQPTEAKTETCRWEAANEPDDQTWHTQCGRNVVFRDDDVAGPFEYCPYCGKQIEIVSEEVEE